MHKRILVTGASGSGTSTLGRGLAGALASQHFDADDFFWQPSDPPFMEKRTVAERVEIMQALFLPRRDWVLSGSVMGWGDAVAARLTHAVFVTADGVERMARLRARETVRLGDLATLQGAAKSAHQEFMDWAVEYDNPAFQGRNRARHAAFLAELSCPVIAVDGGQSPDAVLAQTLAALDG